MSKIDHPNHYNTGNIEVIDAIEDWGLGFHLGNVVKYVARAGHKGDALEDLEKAQWYLKRAIGRAAEELYRATLIKLTEKGSAKGKKTLAEWAEAYADKKGVKILMDAEARYDWGSCKEKEEGAKNLAGCTAAAAEQNQKQMEKKWYPEIFGDDESRGEEDGLLKTYPTEEEVKKLYPTMFVCNEGKKPARYNRERLACTDEAGGDCKICIEEQKHAEEHYPMMFKDDTEDNP